MLSHQEQLMNDLVRVDRLFKQTLKARISIQCRSICGEEIFILIYLGKYILITLVDQYKLDLLDEPIREECPLIYHLDFAAMYPNIILTKWLQEAWNCLHYNWKVYRIVSMKAVYG
ncbi:uncharacterized protein LOC122085912 [Macadamia integrifolia]|uniref:uncharacterized protein LOC122085912 n=1 Tax=Macadamia integrifolia TaxID=60698 RepID=UPI001C4FB94D|nr:uncharacterized protein LOC122085912 [Macadamia integrifolia]